jgi:TonB family protein
MTLRPSLRPDAPNDMPSPDEGASNHRNGSSAPGLLEEITQVARTLSNAGGGDVSLDLALDLVLNETVEQAREATRASGAAIALARDGEMICRATAGNAPHLGARVDTSSGLSAACLQTGTIQECLDTQIDPRVDREACRHLNLRSMLLVPIMEGGTPRGIVEVFSSLPNNFGDSDVKLLQSLATRIVEAKSVSGSGLQEKSLSSPEPALPANPAENLLPELKPALQEDSAAVAADATPPEGARKYDVLTSALVVLVIAAAVLLGLVIGVGQTAKRAQDRSPSVKSETETPTPAPAEPATTQADSGSFSSAPATPQPHKAGPPVGGLVVMQNGKVIYRADASKSSEQSADASQPAGPGGLMHRVDPEYPEAARTQHIQGPVVLDAQVLSDGSVGNIAVVEGNPLLAEAATQAVKQWKYQPFIVNGRQVERQERITVKFSLPPS